MNILVVEDKFDDMEYICGILQEMRQDLMLLKAGSSAKALELLCSQSVDIALVDIMLPDLNGFSLANKIREMEGYELLPIVFVTGSNADPLKAHRRYHCYDYISKPFTKKMFEGIMEPLIRGIERDANHGKAAREKVVFLESGEQLFVVKYSEILYAEINGRIITVHLTDRTVSDIHMHLEDFINSIGADSFVRCHKSYAVNTERITAIQKLNYRLWKIEFDADSTAGSNCMMSKHYRDAVLEVLK